MRGGEVDRGETTRVRDVRRFRVDTEGGESCGERVQGLTARGGGGRGRRSIRDGGVGEEGAGKERGIKRPFCSKTRGQVDLLHRTPLPSYLVHDEISYSRCGCEVLANRCGARGRIVDLKPKVTQISSKSLISQISLEVRSIIGVSLRACALVHTYVHPPSALQHSPNKNS